MVNDSEGLIVTGKPFTTPLLLDLGGLYAEFLTLEMGFQVLTLLGNQKPKLIFIISPTNYHQRRQLCHGEKSTGLESQKVWVLKSLPTFSQLYGPGKALNLSGHSVSSCTNTGIINSTYLTKIVMIHKNV